MVLLESFKKFFPLSTQLLVIAMIKYKKINFAVLQLVGLVCLSIFLTSSVSIGTKEIKSDTLTMMTYNIHHGAPAHSTEINLRNIADVILKSKASIVAIQELDRFTGRSGNVDQIAELEKLLHMKAYFSKSIDHDGGEYGVALFSKYPLVSTQKVNLPMAIAGEQRSIALAQIRLPNGKEFYFGSTHLDLNVPNRTAQVQAIKALEKELDAPLIIGGDFNATPTSAEMILLQESFSLSCPVGGCGFTIPVKTPKRAIDFFAFNSTFNGLFQFKGSHAMVGEEASDHLPHVADFLILD